MANVPQLGTYTSENNSFKIEITSANSSNGHINAVYETNYGPEGSFTDEGQLGDYSWVHNDSKSKDGVAPFSIRFAAAIRPNGRPYCIYDTWTGAYQENNTLLMEGARSYVNSEGVVQVMSLGTLTFSK